MNSKILFVLLISFNFCFSQEIKTELISKIPLKADQFIGVDELGNLFYVENNILFKKSKTENLSYSNINLGELTTVNIQNPFKIILFYKDFNSVILLDNKLNELTDQIDFTRETLFNNVLFVGPSSENNLWLYADDNKLHLYNFQNLTEQIQTQSITFYQKDFNLISVRSNYKNVWLLSKTGIIQFNEYGNFIQSFKIENLDNIYPFRKGIIYTKKKQFYYKNKEESIPIALEFKLDIKDIYINNSSIYIYDGTNIYQYKLKS